MSFEFPEIAGLQEYRDKADIIEEIREELMQRWGNVEANSQAQHFLFSYLNDKKYDHPWLSWRIRMSGGKINVVLFFDGLPNGHHRMEDIKVKEGIL